MHLSVVAKETPHKTAVVLGNTRVSYGALDAASRRIAVSSRHSGLSRGDVMGVMMSTGPEVVAAIAAGQRSGLYCLPLGPKLTASELKYILEDSGAKLLITDSENEDKVFAAALGIPGLTVTSIATIDHLFKLEDCPLDPDPVEGGDILYTSGTTGLPKGVRRPLGFKPLGSDLRRAQRLRELFAMDADTVFFSPAPLHHAAPLRFSMDLLRLGGTLVLNSHFNAKAALRLLVKERVTHSQWVPTMFTRLLAERDANFGAPSHRVAIHAGAPCSVELKKEMISWWGPILHEYYSGTESIGFTHITSEEWLKKIGSVGRASGCDIHILNDEAEPLPAGHRGKVFFSGREAVAYHNDAKKTAAALSPQGYSTMGDLGYLDNDGYLFLTDREAFTIISGGVNVYPREVEEAISNDSLVAEAAVFGSPDTDLGEVVTAVVELQHGCEPTLEVAKTIRERLRAQLSPYKLPRKLAFVDQMPLTDSGKIHKARIRNTWESQCDHVYGRTALDEK